MDDAEETRVDCWKDPSDCYQAEDEEDDELKIAPIRIPRINSLPKNRQRSQSDDVCSTCTSCESPGTSVMTPLSSTRTSAALSITEQEIITHLCSSSKKSEEVKTLDLSAVAKKTRKSLKSLGGLTQFVNLTQLDVSNNALITTEGVEAFTQLEILCISRNHLKKISSSLFSLVSLKQLDISGNFIRHIPKAIADLELLESLNLSGNNLSVLGEVDVLSKLSNLHTCNLSANPFCKLPTYKDYVICKVVSLEKLDDSVITPSSREKSRKRFSDAMFSKDICLREAEIAHENEQNRLREAQNALEVENLKLRGELQVKSKLLQNKSKAWSTATEQLLQLQQEVAMLHLERRSLSGSSYGNQSAMSQQSVSARSPSGSTQSFGSSQTFLYSPRNSRDYDGADDQSKDLQLHLHRPPRSISPVRSGRSLSVDSQLHQTLRYCSQQESSDGTSDSSDLFSIKESTTAKNFIDSACSPMRMSTENQRYSLSHQQTQAMTTSHILKGASQPQRSKSFDHVRKAFTDLSGGTQVDASIDIPLHEDEALKPNADIRRSVQFPMYEDDVACPAYEDRDECQESNFDQRIGSPREDRQTPLFYRTSSSPGRLLSSPSPSPRSQSHHSWFPQEEDSRFHPHIVGNSSSPSNSSLQQANRAKKDVLVKQVQALQSCKQSLLQDIAKEEHILHALKQERTAYSNQIERLDSNIKACLYENQAALFNPNGIPGAGSASSSAVMNIKHREDDHDRARLEMLRSKLRFAEDKEKEIEMTMVQMTKRVLQTDTRISNPTTSPFDKEIFALTHKLQLVIVQKEEIHLEMSRLMAQMREKNKQQGMSDSDTMKVFSEHAPSLQISASVTELQPNARSEDTPELAESKQALEELKKRLQDVIGRIRVKEDLIASLVKDLKEVEHELQHFGQLSPSIDSRTPRRRSISLDFHPTVRPQPGMDIVQQELDICLKELGDMKPQGSNECSAAEMPPLAIKLDTAECTNSPRNSVNDTATSHGESQSTAREEYASPAIGEDRSSASFYLKFKELLTAEMLEEIKKDIYEKLSRQLVAAAASWGSERETTNQQERKELHEEIAAALEAHMKMAMESYYKKKEEATVDEPQPSEGSSSPTARYQRNGKNHTRSKENQDSPVASSAEDVCWSQIDDFLPVDAKYAMKYRFVKHRSLSSPSSPTGGNAKGQSRSAGAQRVLKACERLVSIENDSKIDAVSSIELDPMGNKKSSLKILLMGARDLPTSHLRTKNLDPYVCFEVVYPEHIVPSTVRTTASISSPTTRNYKEDASYHTQQFRSRTQKKSMYPVWDEEFEFIPILSLRGYLHVRILNDRKMSREQLVGEVKIPLRTLLHQKRVVDWYQLGLTVTSNGTSKSSSRKGTSRLCGGEVRLQLQLTYSRLEKCKRAVDELVTKYYHEHNQLPPFIESVAGFDKGKDQNPEQPEEDEMEPLFALREEIVAMEQQQQSRSPSPVPHVKTDSSSYSTWRVEHELSMGRSGDGSNDSRLDSGHRKHSSPELYDPNTGALAEQPQKPQLSPARRASLWESTTTSDAKRPSKSSFAPSNTDQWISHSVVKSSQTTGSSLLTHKSIVYKVPSKAKCGPMSHSKTFVGASRSKRSSSALRSASVRQKPLVSSIEDPPECFDEYSVYHPHFHCSDVLDLGNFPDGRTRTQRHTLYSWPSHSRLHERKTDLRIFKSPGYARRQPSTGFPERYIGLDNQTSERLKRIFGRMDAG